jgi:phosphohistidine phosphatase
MRLYFLRHASASSVAPSDTERELTKEGKEEARIAGAALAELGVKPAIVLSSPLVRARQTAEIAAREFKFGVEVETVDELQNDMEIADLLHALQPRVDAKEILLVGHMPSLSEHIAVLIGAQSADGLPLGKGSVACVELDQLRAGAGALRWLMRQKQLGMIAR